MQDIMLGKESFIINGKPTQIIAGAIHYWRVPRAYWRDRLLKLKAGGCNTLETYVAWNLHEPESGKFDFSGGLDLEAYIRLAGELGLFVLVRPGPYICSEWEFGGLPWWLLADENIRLRCMDKTYIGHVDRWFGELIPRLATLQLACGGPVIAVQVENEYGSYGNDAVYLEHIKQLLISGGIDSALLYTSDGPEDWMLQGGTLPDVFKTANFGSHPDTAFPKLREYQKDGPLMCAEYWNGWFDHWGEDHTVHVRDPKDAAAVLDEMLAAGASVSMYMFHGGTNFGFMAGANNFGRHEPTVTSYDYDAPISECGDLTEKYFLFRDVIAKYRDIPPVQLLPQVSKVAYGLVELKKQALLLENASLIGSAHREPCPYPMEKLGQGYGFILYSTTVSGPRGKLPLIIQDVHDRALVFLDGAYLGVINRDDPSEIEFAVPQGGARLDVLVENMGRSNYGNYMLDRKGVTIGIRHGQQYLFNYDIRTLPMDDLQKLHYKSYCGTPAGPAFYRSAFTVDEPGDTFLKLEGWTKGFVTINGFNIGRYWNIGPQKTLYVPSTLLKKGENEIVVFELHGAEKASVEFVDHCELG